MRRLLLAPLTYRRTFTERGNSWGVDPDRMIKTPYVETYTQPLWRHTVAQLWHAVDMHITDVPGWRTLERVARWRHDRTCNDDCVTGHRPGCEPIPMCGQMPLYVTLDLICFELHHKERVHVSRTTGEPEYIERKAQ